MIHLTPEMLEATYELLRTTPPFRRWKLPEADDVEFHVTRHRVLSGQYTYLRSKKRVLWHRIEISTTCNKNLRDMMETMAHEMCHIRQRTADRAAKTRTLTHGRAFKRLAALVCRHHGFNPKTF